MKKHTKYHATVIALSAAALLARAEPTLFDIGLQTEYVNYNEPRLMSEQGLLAGPFIAARTEKPPVTLRLFSSYVAGNLQYKTNPRTRLDLSDYTFNTILDARCEAGLHQILWNRQITGYTGFGYRILMDRLPDMDRFPGYDREQVYHYLPIGLDMDITGPQHWQLTARLEYDIFIKGENTSMNETVEQDSGWGCRASLSALHTTPNLPAQGRLRAETFAEYWDIDRSGWSRINAIYEPENTSLMIGIRVSAGF